VINRTRSWGRWWALAGAVVAVLTLSACAAAPMSVGTPNPAPKAAPPPAFSPPYPFGAVQQKAPSVTDGSVPVIKRISIDKPYVFITMDDGAVKDPDALALIQQTGGHPVLFLNQKYVTGHEAYFKAILDSTGAVLGDHTVSHPDLRGKPFDFQHKEICDDADDLQRGLGQRPALFRPPFGAYDATTLKAAASCGMRASVLWTAAVNDGVVQLQAGNKLRPGDIVLMHFRKTFKADYTAFVEQAKKDGLTPVPLADFLG
jgi:peptidoglycan/xylan/chitin deacetylase (PgdA/CDA1 family)